jgi:hypothetical protein
MHLDKAWIMNEEGLFMLTFLNFRNDNNGIQWWFRPDADRSRNRRRSRLGTACVSARMQRRWDSSELLLHLQVGILLRNEQSVLRLSIQHHRLLPAALYPRRWYKAISLGRKPADAWTADRSTWISINCVFSISRVSFCAMRVTIINAPRSRHSRRN